MKKEVQFSIYMDHDISESELIEWLKYKLGQVAIMSCGNPLEDEDIEAHNVKIIK